MLIAHPALGYLVGETYKKKKKLKLSDSQTVFWVVWAVVTGIGPDWDFFLAPLTGTPVFLHRHMFTHTPGFWIILGLILLFTIKLWGDKLTKLKLIINPKHAKDLVYVLFINVFLHLFTDVISGAIPVFWPFSNSVYTLLGTVLPYRYDRLPQLTSVLIVAELIIWVTAVKMFFTRTRRGNTVAGSRTTLVTAILALLLIFIPVCTLSILTYRPAPLNIDYDPDYDKDKIKNTEDNDINGNGLLNISEIYTNEYHEKLKIATEFTANRTTLSLPQELTKYSQYGTLFNLIPNNETLVSYLLMEVGFSIKNDILQDAIIYPERYGIPTKINSYTYPATYTVENLYTYINTYNNMPTKLDTGIIVFTKDIYTEELQVFVIYSVNNALSEVTVLTTSDGWTLEKRLIQVSELVPY
ncbi:metal-dependent hydrolase [Candidatus Dojkabacteria bacterium]|nr:metal-dependent hydrolase [Candidatus Dojkabacteria bacterium]